MRQSSIIMTVPPRADLRLRSSRPATAREICIPPVADLFMRARNSSAEARVMIRLKDKGDLYVHQDANWNVIGLIPDTTPRAALAVLPRPSPSDPQASPVAAS